MVDAEVLAEVLPEVLALLKCVHCSSFFLEVGVVEDHLPHNQRSLRYSSWSWKTGSN